MGKILLSEGLLEYFDAVYGNIGKAYGENEYDKVDREASNLEGDAGCNLAIAKALHIAALLKKYGIKGSQAVLVEDDPAEIKSVRHICRSVYVKQRQGMTEAE